MYSNYIWRWTCINWRTSTWLSLGWKRLFRTEFFAYANFKLVRWAGEHVDVYASKIQLAGRIGFSGRSLETAMKLAFVTRFPNDISKELQQAPAIGTLTMEDLLIRARVLTKDTVANTHVPRSESGVSFEAKPRPGITCYRCRGQGHMTRDGPMGWAPKDRTRRCNPSTAIRSPTLFQCRGNGPKEKMSAPVYSLSKKWGASYHPCTRW